MKNSVVIKSNRSGMTVILDPEVPYEQLLADVAKKFGETSKFWGSVQMTLTLAGRPLTPEQEFQMINVITGNSEIEILCLLDQNLERTSRCEKALNDKLMELSAATGQFYRGDLKGGNTLESEYSIVIIGNVEPGAKVISKGNIVVIGDLKGAAVAGISGNTDAVVAALEMAPTQLKIADFQAACSEKGKRLVKGPAVALVENNQICVKSMRKSFFQR